MWFHNIWRMVKESLQGLDSFWQSVCPATSNQIRRIRFETDQRVESETHQKDKILDYLQGKPEGSDQES